MMLAIICVLLVGGTLTFLFKKRSHVIALATTVLGLVLGVSTIPMFLGGERFVMQHTIARLLDVPITFHLFVDGMSYPFVLLTLVLAFVAVLISNREIHHDRGSHFGILLFLTACIIGVFASVDLIVFFVFWEVVLVLMFLLILHWGHANRKYAAMKFLVYTGIASAGLLLAIILLAETGSFHLLTADVSVLSETKQLIIFGLLLFAFLVKLPAVPFHTWLPDAHVEAPTAGSVLLAGVLLKMGGYGLLRFATLMPDMVLLLQPLLFTLATLSLVYGAFVCLAQYHLKRLIAYSSVNHMGFVLLGVATASTLGHIGALFEMVSHGLIAALLFGLAGALHQKTGTFDLAELRGIISRMPRLGWLLLVGALAGMGLPSLSGFVAEFLVLWASFQVFGLWSLLPLAGVALTAAYMVRLISRCCFGSSQMKRNDTGISILPFAILLFLSFLLGLLPFLLISLLQV